MSVSRIPLANLSQVLRGYQAVRHQDVSTDKGMVFFSNPLQSWILVQRKGDQAVLTFSKDCPCSGMGVKY